MKLKFREKTYLITLLLFLIFFNAGIFSLAFYTYHNNMSVAESLCNEEMRVISEAYEKDSEYINYNSAYLILMKSYGKLYSENKIHLMFTQDGNIKYSNMPSGISSPESGKSYTLRVDNKRFYVISETICDGRYLLTYAKDVSYLDEDFYKISAVFVITSIGASAILAVCLFGVLRKLSKPLEKLRETAGGIANGRFDLRADESGSDEFSLLASDFNRMADQISAHMNELEESAQTKQRMLDNLAHEMRTPLTSIRGYAEYLRDANIGEEEKAEAIEYIISESVRLKSIGEKMLDEAFIRENKINTDRINLGELIFETAKNLSIKASNSGVKLHADAIDVYIECDKLLISLLITNLTDNAIKACRGNGTVIIGCEKKENSVTLFVADNGLGMTEEQISHITEPFYRTDKSRSRSDGGTGLGLSLCKRIAEAHNAELIFESEPEKGTKASVTFTTP